MGPLASIAAEDVWTLMQGSNTLVAESATRSDSVREGSVPDNVSNTFGLHTHSSRCFTQSARMS